MNTKIKFKNYSILVFILIIAVSLRLYRLESKSVWYDEAKSIDHSLRKKITSIVFPGHDLRLPVYFLTLRIWGKVLGKNAITLRLFSVIVSIFAIFMVFKIGEILYNKKVGLLTAFLLTISPFHIFYSQEIGNFTLFVFLTLLLIYTILKIFINDKSVFYFYFAMLSLFLLLTHYFSIFLLLSLNIFFYFQVKKYRDIILKLALIQTAILFILLPFILIKLMVFEPEWFMSISWIPKKSFWDAMISMLETFSYGGSRYGGEDIFIPAKDLVIPRILLFIYTGLIINTLIMNKSNIKNDFENFFFLLLWLLGGFLFSLLFSYIFFPIFVVRHLIFALPAFCILVAKGINNLKKIYLQYIIISSILVIHFFPLLYYFNNELKTPWKKVISYLKDEGVNENDLIVFNPFYEAHVIYYNFDDNIKNVSKGMVSLDLFKKLISQGIPSYIVLDEKQKQFYQSKSISVSENKRVFLIQSRWAGSKMYKMISFLPHAKNKSAPLLSNSYFNSHFAPYDPVETRDYFNSIFHKKEEVYFDYRGVKHLTRDNFKDFRHICYGVYIGEFYVPHAIDSHYNIQ